MSIVFGPVPSRRLGVSLGINNLPDKICTYSCVYCQAGRTRILTIERKKFYDPDKIVEEVLQVLEKGIRVDYISFVPNGEPTLDVNLGKEIELLRNSIPSSIRIAVLTNGSLLWIDSVRKDLSNADYISIKIDTVDESTWKRINRPYPSLSLNKVLNGIERFCREFSNTIVVETMFVENLNTNNRDIEKLLDYLSRLENIAKYYIAIPVRPPAEPWVSIPSRERLEEIYDVFSSILGSHRVGKLFELEKGEFRSIHRDFIEYIKSIVKVHPLPLEKVVEIAKSMGIEQDVVEILGSVDDLEVVEYRGRVFIKIKR